MYLQQLLLHRPTIKWPWTKQAIVAWMADAVSPRRLQQYALTTDEQMNGRTDRQTEGRHHCIKPLACGGTLIRLFGLDDQDVPHPCLVNRFQPTSKPTQWLSYHHSFQRHNLVNMQFIYIKNFPAKARDTADSTTIRWSQHSSCPRFMRFYEARWL